MTDPPTFRKYDERGAYHWEWADTASPGYAPAAEARYRLIGRRVRGAARVLDVGCGDGFLVNLVAEDAARAVGVDPEVAGIALAADRLRDRPGCSLVVGDGLRLPFRDASFDAVILCDVIEHLESPGSALEECHRVLEPGGRLVVTTPRRLPDHWWDRENHVTEYASDELRDLLSRHFGRVVLTHFISRRWWRLRKRLGKIFIRWWARLLFNPFLATGLDPGRYCHLLATCTKAGSRTASPTEGRDRSADGGTWRGP